MKHITKTLAGLALACCMASSQAAPIQSMMIEEIGIASGGLGTSGLANGGGWGNTFSSTGTYSTPPSFFVSDGSDGALVMGTTQANGTISTGFTWGGNHFNFNTLSGAPSGSIAGSAMFLDVSGLVAEFTLGNLGFPTTPDPATLLTHVSVIDANHYFYTADWAHVFNNDVYDVTTLAAQPGWNGSGVVLHLEGIATLATIPEPGTLWLLSASALGLMASRRRKHA